MLMKDNLNVFQYDWACTPAMTELKPDCLKNKAVLVSGHNIARAIAYTILTLNDKLGLGAKVFLCSVDKDFEAQIPPAISERTDLILNSTERIGDIKQKVDIVIHTGLCGHKIEGTLAEFSRETGSLKSVLSFAEAKAAERFIMLSDSRVYGKGQNKYRYFAEKEMGYCSTEDYGVQLIRTLESICAQNTSDYTILRSGNVIAPGAGLYNGMEEVFEAVAKAKEIELESTDRKISLIYMTDVFESIVYSIKEKLCGVYNIGSDNMTVSTGTLAANLHDLFSDNARIKMTKSNEFEGNALNCDKFNDKGFGTIIDLDTALELAVMSYTDSDASDFRFPHEHKGRLSAIQEILMGYLLEVDRICKKHNIRWYLGGGTLLGAARHKGFIPWDDDVDIMMLREDYDKFLEIAPDELPEGMILQDPKKDKSYNYCYAKLRITDTIFATDFSKNHKGMDNGFAFDIFCHDKTANSKIGQKIHSKLTLFWLACVFNKWNHRKAQNDSKIQSFITNTLKNIFPLRFSTRMLLFTLEMFKRKKNAKYLYDGMGKSVHKGGFDKSFLDDEIRLEFNGYPMPVPAKYKEYLTNHYGDYMELAPLSTRLMGHDITLSDLGKYADFQISNKELIQH
jgi:lipopolysaccharide cholinephosphotransferase